MTTITPNLWFDAQALEAAEYYCSIFPDAKIHKVLRWPEGMRDEHGGSGQAGDVLTVEWELAGQRFVGINGGPQFTFDEAVSFEIRLDTQEEVDRYWDRLIADGGEPSMCGWLKDKFGLSWQIVPKGMVELFEDADPQRAARAMKAMMQQTKLDLAEVQAAADGVTV